MKTAELNVACSWQPRRDRRSADVLSAGEGLDDEHRGAAMPADEGGSVATVIGAALAGVSGRRGGADAEARERWGYRVCDWRWQASRSVGSDESRRAARATGSGA